MNLYLIRHGKTIANEKRLYCGFTDVPLSEEGHKALLELKAQKIYPHSELYMVSGLMRTVETANILFDSPSLETIADLREMSFGEFEMHSYDALKSQDSYQKWMLDIEHEKPPGGESKKEFTFRVIEGFALIKDLCKNNGISEAAVVTHGGVIATIMEFLYPEQKNFYQWQPECGRGYALQFEDADIIQYTKI